MTKRLSRDLGEYNINVNAIAPGLVRTDMGLSIGRVSSEEQIQMLKNNEERTILHRIGEPEEIANVALFLSSNESSYITGQVITVDGGRMDFLTRSQ